MTALDWGIVAFAVLMAFWGYQQGLLVGAFSLAGFVAGAYLGSRLGPELLPDGSESPYAPAIGLAGAVLVGGILAVTGEGAGFALRSRLVRGPLSDAIDGSGGATLVAALGLLLAWIVGVVALNVPSSPELRKAVQRSLILSSLNEVLPPSSVLNTLNRIDPGFEIEGPGAKVGPPDSRLARDPEVKAAGDSVVRVLGTACGLGVEGSGWVAAPGLVATNAHVVAGQDDTTVTGSDDVRRDATAVAYDSTNDVAVLRVSGSTGRPLGFGPPAPGTAGATLGYPENGPFEISPARVGATTTVTTTDSYGHGPVRRPLTSLRGSIRSGNSGGPVVDGAGKVLTTVFAATTSGPRGGFGVPNEIVRRALQSGSGEVDTGPCAR